MYPGPIGRIPGKSAVEISVSEIKASFLRARKINSPNFQFLGLKISGESSGTVGEKNGRRSMYAFDS